MTPLFVCLLAFLAAGCDAPNTPLAPPRPRLTAASDTTAVLNAPDTTFTIEVVYEAGWEGAPAFTAADTEVISRAIRRWERVVVGDVPDVEYQGIPIDDLRIYFFPRPTRPDSSRGYRGAALMSSFFYRDGGVPHTGEIYLYIRSDNNWFYSVVLHEIGHALGLVFPLKSDPRPRPIYSLDGPAVLRVFGRPAAIYRGHFEVDEVGFELMAAPWPYSFPSLSKLSIAALEDMGYTVNYNAADPPRRGKAPPRRGKAIAGPAPPLLWCGVHHLAPAE